MSTAGALLTYAALCLTPALVFGALDAVLSPEDNALVRLGGWAVNRTRRQRTVPPTSPPDPFDALAVQVRLERLACEIDVLIARSDGAARGHHLRVAVAAYEDLLAEACRLAGVQTAEFPPGAVGRLRREAELRALGWSW